MVNLDGMQNVVAAGGIWMWVAVVITCLLFGVWIWKAWKGDKSEYATPGHAMNVVKSKASRRASLIPQECLDEVEITEVMLGIGEFKCMCFRKVKNAAVVDFTTIPKPIGELYNFALSCPMPGSGYIVKVQDGKVVDYDPRSVTYVLKESPEYAWFATQWDIVKQVFFVPVSAWKSASAWFAGAMMAITFILGLVVMGG